MSQIGSEKQFFKFTVRARVRVPYGTVLNASWQCGSNDTVPRAPRTAGFWYPPRPPPTTKERPPLYHYHAPGSPSPN